MTVRDLIEQLARCDLHLLVVIEDADEGCLLNVAKVELVENNVVIGGSYTDRYRSTE